MDNSSINSQILSHVEIWYENNYLTLIHNSKGEPISNPFVYGEPVFEGNKQKIMIVGQEARNYSKFECKPDFKESQLWTVAYLERQVYKNKNGEKYNNSPFWSFQRFLHSHDFNPTWNNLDKAHIREGEETKPLTVLFEKILGMPLENERKTLLQKEIDISKPELVLFVTGPEYYESMSVSLQCDIDKLCMKKPTKENIVVDITKEAGISIPCVWTYHPNYLIRAAKNNKIFEIVLDEIREVLK